MKKKEPKKNFSYKADEKVVVKAREKVWKETKGKQNTGDLHLFRKQP